MRFHHRKLTRNQLNNSVNDLDKLRTRITAIADNNSEYAKQLDESLEHLQEAAKIIFELQTEHDIYCKGF